ncbi:hypothetical protein A3Q56_03129 [Intoshia linei]|uniref:mannose-1-phosphate guanylyltransferase n=1 Tax=Intoshia linei TaxID=1819745 RepID=A0A177B6A6_9BILA|nr:hypothetical protein A3Q56_03129 [Intoshia linei]
MTTAVLLVGGYGTRLRPLTISKPKPLVEFGNKPIIEHQIEALIKVGVKHIIMGVNYMPEKLNESVFEISQRLNIRITINMEDEPLGTGRLLFKFMFYYSKCNKTLFSAGSIANAAKYLENDEHFFVFNSDITCEFPLQEFMDHHLKHDGIGTIAITKVDEPSKYGVLVYDESTMKINKFVEKPAIFVSNKINAGLYLFRNAILDMIELKPTSIEREIFPKLASQNALYAFNMKGHWMDIGQPKDFIKGTSLYLNYLETINDDSLIQDRKGFIGNVKMHHNVKIGVDVKIGPNVVIGCGVIIGNGVCIKNTTLLADCHVMDYSIINTCIIGWKCKIGKWARLENQCILGEDVRIGEEMCLNKCIVFPHKEIRESESEKIII